VLHARGSLKTQDAKKSPKIAIWAPLHNFVGLCHVSTIGKNLLSSNMSSTCPHNMVRGQDPNVSFVVNVVSTFHWQFMVQRFGFNRSLLFYTGRFILGQQPCAELAVQENKKKKKVVFGKFLVDFGSFSFVFGIYYTPCQSRATKISSTIR